MIDEGEGSFATVSERMLQAHGCTLLAVAVEAIDHGLAHGCPPALNPQGFARELASKGASFVTLSLGGALRGCIGSAEAHRPLIADVSANAFAAAFRDPRFSKLSLAERAGLTISLSVLSPPQPLAAVSECELLARIRPGEDGLIIASNGCRALFLPQVWKTLPAPRQFLAELKVKAGLAPDHWSDDFRAWRFVTRSITAAPTAEARAAAGAAGLPA